MAQERNKERFANAIYFHLGGLDLFHPEAISQQLLPVWYHVIIYQEAGNDCSWHVS